MTVDCPLICYICGEDKNESTIDLVGCLIDQESAEKRMIEKFQDKDLSSSGYIYICSDCHRENPAYARNVEKKYGVCTIT